MKRSPSKKGVERRKRPRSASRRVPKVQSARPQKQREESINLADPAPASSAEQQRASGAQLAVEEGESCQNCGKALQSEDRALFVEEEIGRIFCSENCITGYFTPEIERLEDEYRRRLSANDLTPDERESFAHLRWITLQEPDEIWRQKTLSGDFRYTLISEFQPSSKSIWCICICLFLKGEPSFLYLAFTTKNSAMANAYRRGERVEWVKKEQIEAVKDESGTNSSTANSLRSDRLADEWTDDETFLAQISQERQEDDIPVEEFKNYERCLEETLEAPDEVWSCQMGEPPISLYHFIRYYPPLPSDEEGTGYWYLIIARETEEEEQIEVLDAFPTRDSSLVDRYRRGEQEVGHTPPGPVGRVVH